MNNKPDKCPKCQGEIIGVEYLLTDKEHYDGVSEWACVNALQLDLESKVNCDYRIGRFCGRELKPNEVERRYCNDLIGIDAHPTVK